MEFKTGKFAEVSSVLKNRNFAVYTACNSISMVGVWMQRLSVGWLTWQLTGSELWIGAIAFADLLPVVIIGPLAGVWVDRPMRRLLIKLCQSVMLLQSLILLALTALDLIGVRLLFSLVLVNGIVAAIYHPVRLSVVPSLVGRNQLLAGVSLTAVTFNLARFAGPALAGLVIAVFGIPASFFLVAVSYGIMLFAVFRIDIPPRPWLSAHTRKPALHELREGANYAVTTPAIALVLSSQVLVAVCVRPVGELLPAFVGTVFSSGPETLALLTSAMGAGAIVASLRLLLWHTGGGLVKMSLSSMGLSGVAVILFSLIHNAWAAAAVIFGVAYWVSVSGIACQTLIQTFVDKTMRGRVLSIWAAIYRGAPGIGALLIGWLSESLGLALPTAVMALICVCAAIWLYRIRSVMSAYFDRPD